MVDRSDYSGLDGSGYRSHDALAVGMLAMLWKGQAAPLIMKGRQGVNPVQTLHSRSKLKRRLRTRSRET